MADIVLDELRSGDPWRGLVVRTPQRIRARFFERIALAPMALPTIEDKAPLEGDGYSTGDVLRMPASELVKLTLKRVGQTIQLRWYEARDTTPVELVLFLYALVVGFFFTFVPSGYQQGWSMFTALGLCPRYYGIVKLGMAAFRFGSILNGDRGFRYSMAWIGLILDGCVVGMIWRGNHMSPVIPYALGLPLMDLYAMGRFAKVAHRAPT